MWSNDEVSVINKINKLPQFSDNQLYLESKSYSSFDAQNDNLLCEIKKRNFEKKLIDVLKTMKTRSIVLRTEKKVAIEQVVYVMNLANKNGVKVVLAVDTP